MRFLEVRFSLDGDPSVAPLTRADPYRGKICPFVGKYPIGAGSVGVNPGDPEKPGIEKSSYNVSLSSGEGCYAFRLLDGHVFYDIDLLDYVWDSTNDTKGAQTVWANTISGTITVGGTTCPAG